MIESAEDLFEIEPYSLERSQKETALTRILKQLSEEHRGKCERYGNFIKNMDIDISSVSSYYEIPMLPVRLFKEFDLCSVEKDKVFKTMTSSGTSGQRVSKIFLDRETSANQTKTLVKITSDFLGKKRLPMLILDTKSVVKNRNLFSARGAGILGFSMLGYDVTYALDENMNLDYPVIDAFLEKHQEEPIFLFGFTYIIWQHVYKELSNCKRFLDFSRGILLHGGGFKKLEAEAVDNETYKKKLNEVCGLKHIYNYYGMVEQTGSIYMECECGHLHASNFSDVIIRNPKDFSVCQTGQKGLIQVVSVLAKSYPGHSLLTEDVGEILGEDDCPCGRKGKYFKVHGRIQKAEVRGCSDTYENR
ncbi:acyl-protein synthetase [Hominifimenecus sp. rT4P-3]|uniref:LuxE/PaaK family acyltransferase n=1 Tax=Hominifimenecus sp. rT4P-3 TaxID=3242979 RepID=UPI003DA2FD61